MRAFFIETKTLKMLLLFVLPHSLVPKPLHTFGGYAPEKSLRGSLERHISWLDKEISTLDKAIQARSRTH